MQGFRTANVRERGTIPVMIEIETVVGNARNQYDTRFGVYVRVSCSYVGTYNATAGQYTEFLDVVAAGDTCGRYNTQMMANRDGFRIERLGTSPHYSYRVNSDWANRVHSCLVG